MLIRELSQAWFDDGFGDIDGALQPALLGIFVFLFLQELILAVHLCVVWEGFRGVLERLFVDFVQIFAVRYLVLKGVVFVSEDVGLLAEIVHELQLDLSLLKQTL